MAITQEEKSVHKQMRRGTRACRECRRRKVKCIYDNDKDDICQLCIAHNRRCIRQGSVRGGSTSQCNSVQVQIKRLESAVEKLAREEVNADASESARTDKLIPTDTVAHENEGSEFSQGRLDKKSPIFSLFNNDTFQEHGVHESYAADLRTSLLFPDQHASDREKLLTTIANVPNIFDALQFGGHWWIAWRAQHYALRKTAEHTSLHDFVQMKLREDSCVSVAMGLLAIAVSLDQLRPGLDDLNLNLPVPANHIMTYILAAVDQIVCDSRKYYEDTEIVLLFMMRAKHHTETNQLRKAWLGIRRAIHCAQAIQYGTSNPIDGPLTDGQAEQQRFLASVFEIQHLMSMVLGFPHIKDVAFTDARALTVLRNPEIQDESLKMRALRRVVAVLAGQINDRNANGEISDETTEMLQHTLGTIAIQMPSGWWDMLTRPVSVVSQYRYESIMVQFWFWTVQSYLHMPYLIKPRNSPAGKRYRQLCLEGSRNVIKAFNSLRSEPSVSVYMCNCDDLQALIGGCILLVGILQDAAPKSQSDTAQFNGQYPPVESRDGHVESDLALVEALKDVFRYRTLEQGSSISKQGLQVLEELTSFAYYDDNDNEASTYYQYKQILSNTGIDDNRLKRTIMLPYFGTINIELREKISNQKTFSSPRHDSSTPPANADWDYLDYPILQEPSLYLPHSSGKDDTIDLNSASNFDLVPTVTEGYSYDGTMNMSGSLQLPQCLQPGYDLEPIAWDTWGRFMFDQELGQDWNPELEGTDVERHERIGYGSTLL